MKHDLDQLRTWIEIDAKAAKKNYDTFRRLIGKKAQLWSVVKSNAYGHGLFAFSELMDEFGVDSFCVDSIVEGLALRRAGIKRPILVLGQTLPARFAEAASQDITIAISNFEALRALAHASASGPRAKKSPDFHIKIDTGMHRQGFYPEDAARVAALIKKTGPNIKNSLKGIFTHFASAKDINYPTYTDEQLKNFKKAIGIFENAGFANLMKHAAATGGTLISSKYHFDAVRVGIGLAGIWPSKELEIQLGGSGGKNSIALHPVLSWRATVSEVKRVKKGDYVGYNMTERMSGDATIAIIPVGYWHGFPWALSSSGEVLIRGKRVRVLGRVSMDMIAVGPVPAGTKPGDVATLIGETITAEDQAARSHGATFNYELLTRLNPLMERVIIR